MSDATVRCARLESNTYKERKIPVPGMTIANAKSATAIHKGARPLAALMSATTRAITASTRLIDTDVLRQVDAQSQLSLRSFWV
jgi:hypothetical protein